MKETIDQILKAISVPLIALAFLPLWMIVSSINSVSIEPDPRILIGTVYASVITMSFVWFGMKLRTICH